MNYIGSKKFLLDFIENSIVKITGDINDKIFCDLFAGTGVVSAHFKNKVKQVLANDIEPYSYVLVRNKIQNKKRCALDKIVFEPFEGFICKEYALKRSYFSKENAKTIDGFRIAIEKNFDKNDDEYYFALASLIYSADRVANTTGVYGSYLKKLKYMAKTKMKILPYDFEVSKNEHKVYNEDANQLIKSICGDILYLDPPYNHRQYGLNYHILNTIVDYKEFDVLGKSGLRDYYRSDYCKVNQAKFALENLIKNAQFKYIFLSYSDDGILDKITIEKIFTKFGKYTRFTKPHPRLRVSKNSKKGEVIEYLHVLEKNGL